MGEVSQGWQMRNEGGWAGSYTVRQGRPQLEIPSNKRLKEVGRELGVWTGGGEHFGEGTPVEGF